MAELIRPNKIDLPASFATMKVKDTLEIPLQEATESSVRTAASRYGDSHKVVLRVNVNTGKLVSVVTRLA